MKAGLLNLLLIGSGGFIGSILRYLTGGLAHRLLPHVAFPIGTLVVNLLGCFLIGFVSGLVEVRQMLAPETRLFLMIGLLGGFTTFSTFGIETAAMIKDGALLPAVANVLVQVVAGLAAVWLGYSLTRIL